MEIPRDELIDGDDSLHDLSAEMAQSVERYTEQFRERFPCPEDLLENGSLAALLAELDEEIEQLETSETCEPRAVIKKSDGLNGQRSLARNMVRDIHGRIYQGGITVGEAITRYLGNHKLGTEHAHYAEVKSARVIERNQFIDQVEACLKVDLIDR